MTYRTNKTYRTTLGFLVLGFWFWVLAPPGAWAHQHMDQSCFTKEECADPSGTYKGIAEPAADCQDQAKEWVDAGLTYHCYPKYSLPGGSYKLQVPFLSPIFRGTTKSLEDYISILYQLLISIAGIIAGIMIVWAGVKWLTSGGNPERISDARHKIGNALIGLILVMSSYVLLQTINPDLVRLRVPPIKMIRAYTLSPWCPNDGPFQGKYACGRDDYKVPSLGKCAGVHCAQGGCFRWKDPGQEKYKYACLQKEQCPSQCKEITYSNPALGFETGTPSKIWWGYCLTDICKDKIPAGCRKAGGLDACGDRKKEGEWGCEKDSDCARDQNLFCHKVGALSANTCQRKSGSGAKQVGEGTACESDSHCAPGLVCNQAYFNKCQDPKKATESALCERDKECAPGLKCVDTAGNNECYDGSPNDPCCSSVECKSGKCSVEKGRSCNWGGSCS